MRNVTDRTSNPFGMEPACSSFVPGYGDANADFHVIGDHPGRHGGGDTGVPFTNESGLRLQRALAEADLLESVGAEPGMRQTFFSYLHMCVPDGDGDPTDDAYGDMERFFDAELRAIAAHVLLPVGARATEYVLRNYTAQAHKTTIDMAHLHGEELRGSGFLVVPIRDPVEWNDDDHTDLVAGIETLRSTDFRREADLGRFVAGNDAYFVR